MTGTLLVSPAIMMYLVNSMVYGTRRFRVTFRDEGHSDNWNLVGKICYHDVPS